MRKHQQGDAERRPCKNHIHSLSAAQVLLSGKRQIIKDNKETQNQHSDQTQMLVQTENTKTFSL